MSNKRTMPRMCQRCGVTFLARPAVVNTGGALYCSIRCVTRRPGEPTILSEDGLTARIVLRSRDGNIQGYAIVDATDALLVGQWAWHMNDSGYAARFCPIAKRSLRMHRILLGLNIGDESQGDHINRNRLDNRRCNLRIVTRGGNAQNVPSRHGSTSSHRGVYWDKSRHKWQACVRIDGKKVTLGRFSDEAQAARIARDARLCLYPNAVD